MRKRYVVSNTDQPTTSHDGELPLDRDCAIYYRQSSLPQTENVSYKIQTEDLPAWALTLGWKPEQVILIDDDQGISGAKGFDERPGLSRLYDLITSRAIGCVICADPDRLSRDHWQILPNVLMKTCEESHVIIKTPAMTFDFCGPYAAFSRLAFRQSSQMAADFLKTYIRGKMLPARQWLIDRGLYGGGSVCLGYVIGSDGKYQPFPLLAELVQQCLEFVIRNDCNLKRTLGYIEQSSLRFPPRAELESHIPAGTKLVLSPFYCGDYQKKRGVLGVPGYQVLQDFCLSAVRLGHWMDRGKVIRWNNHEPILDEHLFFKAFNRLSDVTFTGEPNPHFVASPSKGRFYNRKPSEPRNEPEPLLKGLGLLVTHDKSGGKCFAHSMWSNKHNRYFYRVQGDFPWQKEARFVDSQIEQMICLRLSATQAEQIVEAIAKNHTERSKLEKRMKQQLTGLAKEKTRISAKFVEDVPPEWIEQARAKYLACGQQEAQIRAKLADLSQENEQDRRIAGLKADLDGLAEHWGCLTREEKVGAIRLVVSSIWVTPKNGDLRIDLLWKDQGIYPNPETGEKPIGPEYGVFTLPNGEIDLLFDDTSSATMPIRRGISGWTSREINCLRSLVAGGADQVEICENLPGRTWRQIRLKASRLGLDLQVRPLPMHEFENYGMFLKRTTNSSDCVDQNRHAGNRCGS